MNQNFLLAPEAKRRIASGEFDRKLTAYYGVSGDALAPYRARLIAAIDGFTEQFGSRPLRIFSVSGRTELGGNHTDHQHGRVLAGGISLDMLAVAAPTDNPEITVYSENCPVNRVSVTETAMKPEERSVFLARYWLCAPIAEIAARHGFTEGKVKTMLRRSRLKLQKQLREEGYR